MTMNRSTCRLLAACGLGAFLALGALGTPAVAQAPKEPTDGFFDVPAREEGEHYGVPYYMVTSAIGGGAIFVMCKSARRG